MKIVNLKSLACGPNGNLGPGIVKVDDDFAAALVASGHATYVAEPAKMKAVETAAIEPVAETAAMPAPRGRRPAKAGDEA